MAAHELGVLSERMAGGMYDARGFLMLISGSDSLIKRIRQLHVPVGMEGGQCHRGNMGEIRDRLSQSPQIYIITLRKA